MAGGKFAKMLADTVQKSGLDMSEAARMQRAKEMGFEGGYQHTSKTRFIGGGTEDFGIPREEQFKKKYGGTYFAKVGETEINESALAGEFGETADYMLRGGNKIDATWKGMSETQKNEVKSIINGIFDQEDIERIRESTGDYDWDPFDSFVSGELWAEAGRDAQDKVINGLLGKYDIIRFKDNPASGVESYSTVVKDPSQIRSVNAAFDPAKKESPNLMAAGLPFAATGGAAVLTALPNDAQAAQDRFRSSDVGSIRAPSNNLALSLSQKAAAYNRIRKERLHPMLDLALPGSEMPEDLLRKMAYGDEITFKDRLMAALGLM